MAKHLGISPELLLLAPLPEHRRGVGQALRSLVMNHGPMPVFVSPDTMPGEIHVADDGIIGGIATGFAVVVQRIHFPIEDWHDANSIVPGKRAVG